VRGGCIDAALRASRATRCAVLRLTLRGARWRDDFNASSRVALPSQETPERSRLAQVEITRNQQKRVSSTPKVQANSCARRKTGFCPYEIDMIASSARRAARDAKRPLHRRNRADDPALETAEQKVLTSRTNRRRAPHRARARCIDATPTRRSTSSCAPLRPSRRVPCPSRSCVQLKFQSTGDPNANI
jgi:hypothetical protein